MPESRASHRVTGAIVAGGTSSRFGGAPKGLRTVGGRRIIDRVADALRAVASDSFIVSNADDAEQWDAGLPIVRDVRPERGSLVGLHTALITARTSVLVVAWDMPFVSRALLELITASGETEPFVTIPESPAGLEPFCALYTSACTPIVEAAIDAGDLRMSSMLRRFPSMTRLSEAEVTSVGDPARLFFNVNTPHDLAAAETMEARADSHRG